MFCRLNYQCWLSTRKLVIVRHGQSQCNKIKKWSGWSDAKLTNRGIQQAIACGHNFKKESLGFDIAYCSYLSRTIDTLNNILPRVSQADCEVEIKKRWQLNQKFYGALQGLDKMTIVHKYGKDIVAEWRRSYRITPPVVFREDPRHPANDLLYSNVDPALLPNSQHLGHVLERVSDLYHNQIKPDILSNRRILIICHGSVVRAFTNILLGFDYNQSSRFNLPNATPLVLQLGQNLQVQRWKIIDQDGKVQEKMKKIENQLEESNK